MYKISLDDVVKLLQQFFSASITSSQQTPPFCDHVCQNDHSQSVQGGDKNVQK